MNITMIYGSIYVSRSLIAPSTPGDGLNQDNEGSWTPFRLGREKVDFPPTPLFALQSVDGTELDFKKIKRRLF